MTSYYTPIEVARELVRFVPRTASSILEPAVGRGDLLRALLPRLRDDSRIDCVDIDAQALRVVRTDFGPKLGGRLTTIHADFLKWSNRSPKPVYDCVVMNPPFFARGKGLKTAMPDGTSLWLPLEGSFLVRALKLVAPRGRLLAVLPDSVVSSDRCNGLRKFLSEQGSVLRVHQLPEQSFTTVSGRIHLFVYEKDGQQTPTTLCNHQLRRPEKMLVTVSGETRLDYDFHAAISFEDRLVNSTPDLTWRSLEEIASVRRGREASPNLPGNAIHTTDFTDGYWEHISLPDSPSDLSGFTSLGDILIKRVGRGCHLSAGALIAGAGAACTDCVLVIRSNRKSAWPQLLLAIRVVLQLYGKELLQRGTGASYLSQQRLQTLRIPQQIAQRYPREFTKYSAALRARNIAEMRRIELRVVRRLRRKIPSDPSIQKSASSKDDVF